MEEAPGGSPGGLLGFTGKSARRGLGAGSRGRGVAGMSCRCPLLPWS